MADVEGGDGDDNRDNNDDDEEDDGCSLEQLFVCTDYKEFSLQIGPFVTVNVLASPQASTDYDLTGQILWPVSVLLAHYLVKQRFYHLEENSNHHHQEVEEKTTVIELGAGGTAVPSFAAAQCARRVQQVIATDGNDHVVLDLLQQNVQRFNNNHKNNSGNSPVLVSAQQCLWGRRGHVQNLLRIIDSHNNNNDKSSSSASSSSHHVTVVAADVVQWTSVIEPLLHTVKALLWQSSIGSRFVLGIVHRASQTYNLFFNLASQLGFESRRMDDLANLLFRDHDDDGGGAVVPVECREAGGRVTEIYELVLVDRTDPPVLLTNEEEASTTQRNNILVGTSHEQTLALPC